MSWVVSVFLGFCLSLIVVASPPLAAVVVLVLLVVVATTLVAVNPWTPFLCSMGVLLLGYAFLGRGFAYIGTPPVYVGEVVLLIGAVAVMLGGRVTGLLRVRVVWLAVGFAAWGAFRTAPYLWSYGPVALRDGVVWGYSAFALLVASALLSAGVVSRIPRLYGRVFPLVALWIAVALTIRHAAPDLMPRVPGTEVSIVEVMPGDAGAHLGGLAAFLLLGVGRPQRMEYGGVGERREWIWWVFWMIGFFISASLNRGALVSVAAALCIVFVFKPFSPWWKPVIVGSLLVLSSVMFKLEFDSGQPRNLSPPQVVTNAASILGPDLREGTKHWRLDWWKDIVGYTVAGEYFWMGKGFGVNLASDDGYQVLAGELLRSPHNGHMTILARSGVPGLTLWIMLQTAFVVGLVGAWYRSRKLGDRRWAAVNIWILAYWAAFMVNGSFSVFFESPQGGIWYWSVLGFGIAAVEVQRRTTGTGPCPLNHR